MSAAILPLLWRNCNHNCGEADRYAVPMQKSRAALVLAANVRALMKAHGDMSQEDVAKLSGVSKSAIGYLLNYKDKDSRHAGIDTIEALARAFKVSISSLVDEAFTDVRARELQAERPPPQEGMTTPKSVEGLARAIGLLERVLKKGYKRPPAAGQAELIVAISGDLDAGIAREVIERYVEDQLRVIGDGGKPPRGTAGGRRRSEGIKKA